MEQEDIMEKEFSVFSITRSDVVCYLTSKFDLEYDNPKVNEFALNLTDGQMSDLAWSMSDFVDTDECDDAFDEMFENEEYLKELNNLEEVI